MTTRSASQKATKKVSDEELARAEKRGAEQLRAKLREMLNDRRRVVRLGDQQIEVVEVSAVTSLLMPPPCHPQIVARWGSERRGPDRVAADGR